jgi:GntR family transcriptional repressor for pyruvate dehydrogenase complex
MYEVLKNKKENNLTTMGINIFSENKGMLHRDSVPVSIMNLIIDYLLLKKLKPGSKLPTENEFVELLEVGRNSVREAIKMLNCLGIVEIRRGLGTFISESMSDSLYNPLIISLAFEQGVSEELGELRYLFAAGVAEFVVDRATDEDIAKLKEANERFGEAIKNSPDDIVLLRDLDINFHKQFVEISRNKFIIKMGNAIYTIYRATTEKNLKLVPRNIYKNHNKMIQLIQKKDKDALIKLSKRLIEETIERIRKAENE